MLPTVDAELISSTWIMDHWITVQFHYITNLVMYAMNQKISYEQMLRCDCDLKQCSVHSLHVDYCSTHQSQLNTASSGLSYASC